jgi:hypothetical protein
MPNDIRPADAFAPCRICGASFPTRQEKEQHLRLHCVLCEVLFESRDTLFDHVKDRHPNEGGGVVWPRDQVKANSPSEDEDWVEHALDPAGDPISHDD